MMIFYYVCIACACLGLVALLFAWRSYVKAVRHYNYRVLKSAYTSQMIQQFRRAEPSVLLTMARKKVAQKPLSFEGIPIVRDCERLDDVE